MKKINTNPANPFPVILIGTLFAIKFVSPNFLYLVMLFIFEFSNFLLANSKKDDILTSWTYSNSNKWIINLIFYKILILKFFLLCNEALYMFNSLKFFLL